VQNRGQTSCRKSERRQGRKTSETCRGDRLTMDHNSRAAAGRPRSRPLGPGIAWPSTDPLSGPRSLALLHGFTTRREYLEGFTLRVGESRVEKLARFRRSIVSRASRASFFCPSGPNPMRCAPLPVKDGNSVPEIVSFSRYSKRKYARCSRFPAGNCKAGPADFEYVDRGLQIDGRGLRFIQKHCRGVRHITHESEITFGYQE